MSITRRTWLGGSIAATGWALGASGAGPQPSDFPAKRHQGNLQFLRRARART